MRRIGAWVEGRYSIRGACHRDMAPAVLAATFIPGGGIPQWGPYAAGAGAPVPVPPARLDCFHRPDRRFTSAFRHQDGFTLIELLVVIIVLGLLVGLVGPRLFGRVGQSKTATAKAQIELLGAGLDQFRLDVGSYPTSGQGLDALQRNPNVPNWNGPYLKKAVPRDPWGNPYKYVCCPGQHGDYDLWSEGADNAPGGEGENADATSWDQGSK